MRVNFDSGSGAHDARGITGARDTRGHHKGARAPPSVQANLQTAPGAEAVGGAQG